MTRAREVIAEWLRATESLGGPNDILDILGRAGFVICPKVATPKMIEAAWADALAEDARGVWDSMIESVLSTLEEE